MIRELSPFLTIPRASSSILTTLYLNPGKFFAIQKKGDDRYVAELRSCFNDVLARMEPDEKIQTEIDECAMLYEDQRGPIFSNVMALQQIQQKSPRKY
jgi:hypothetical protein